MDFRVVQGDIAQQSADALADAAGTSRRTDSGVAGFDLVSGARIIAERIDTYHPSSLSDVRSIAYGDAEYGTVSRIAEGVRGGE